MTSLRSMGNGGGVTKTPKGDQNVIDNLRQQLGNDFTDKKASGKKNRNELGKDDFMKLMSAQLKYQDPISPMKNEEMAAQLAQFSALEQMSNVNTNLEKMAAGAKPQEQMMAASLIGKRISTDAARVQIDKTNPDAQLRFDVSTDASKGSVTVVDAKGEVIREIPLAQMGRGPQAIKWDGKNAKEQDVTPGEYSFRVNLTDASNKPIVVNTGTTGIVSGVVFEQGQPQLMVGDKKFSINVISKIEDAGSDPHVKAAVPVVANSVNPAEAMSAMMGANAASEIAQKSSENKQKIDGLSTIKNDKNNLPKMPTQEKINTEGQSVAAANQKKSAAPIEETSGEQASSAMPIWNPYL